MTEAYRNKQGEIRAVAALRALADELEALDEGNERIDRFNSALSVYGSVDDDYTDADYIEFMVQSTVET